MGREVGFQVTEVPEVEVGDKDLKAWEVYLDEKIPANLFLLQLHLDANHFYLPKV